MLQEVKSDEFYGCLPEREVVKSSASFKVFAGDFGNFTVVVIQGKQGMACGVSKRNPCDRPSETGFCVAAVRAWRDFQGKEAGYSRQHPVSKKEAKRISNSAAINSVLDELDYLDGIE